MCLWIPDVICDILVIWKHSRPIRWIKFIHCTPNLVAGDVIPRLNELEISECLLMSLYNCKNLKIWTLPKIWVSTVDLIPWKNSQSVDPHKEQLPVLAGYKQKIIQKVLYFFQFIRPGCLQDWSLYSNGVGIGTRWKIITCQLSWSYYSNLDVKNTWISMWPLFSPCVDFIVCLSNIYIYARLLKLRSNLNVQHHYISSPLGRHRIGGFVSVDILYFYQSRNYMFTNGVITVSFLLKYGMYANDRC